MISMRRARVPAVLAAIALGNLGLSDRCSADPPSCNSPASYRLFNTSTGPGTATCGRYEPIPWVNPGWFLNNPRGTGVDDPWRPPTHWPETRYPVVPAYTRPSYGFYETSWRVLPLCNAPPRTAGPIYPAGYQSSPPPALNQAVAPIQPPQGGQPVPEQGPPLPRPPVVPPAVQPAQQGPPAATAPGANGQFLPRAVPPEAAPTTVPTVPLQPQKATPPTNELQPQPPKATPPAPPPNLRNKQGAVPDPFDRSAMLDLQREEAPEIRVQPF
jgi:hypothetical protein